MRYKVIRSTYREITDDIEDVISKLEKDINIQIELGFVPVGGITTTVTGELLNPLEDKRRTVLTFWQAMYKP